MEEYNIDDYDLFIFDFDGTIMNTEPYHYNTYLKAIKEYNNEINLTQNQYFKLVHDLDRTNFEKLFENFTSEVYKKKSEYYYEIVKDENTRNLVKDYLDKKKIETRICFPPIHLQPVYQKLYGFKSNTFPISELAARTTLCMPMIIGLSEKIQQDIVNYVSEAIRET